MSWTKNYHNKHHIGEWTYGSIAVNDFEEGAHLTIGRFCSIADGVKIFLGGNHRTDWVTTYPFHQKWPTVGPVSGHPATKGDVVIGHDVWIGTDAMIMSGVTIGHGAVIGARSQVTRSVPPYAIAAGNPARVKRFRFEPDIIAQLLAIAWWDWPEPKIREALPIMLSRKIQVFIERYGKLKSEAQ